MLYCTSCRKEIADAAKIARWSPEEGMDAILFTCEHCQAINLMLAIKIPTPETTHSTREEARNDDPRGTP
jgi:RNase P subunit RPR2